VAFFRLRHGNSGLRGGRCCDEFQRRCRPGDFARLDHGEAANGIVFHIDVDDAVFSLTKFFTHAEQVRGVKRRGLLGQAAREIGVADDGHAMLYHRLAGLRQFAVAALLCGHVDNHAAGLHRLHHLGGDEFWRGLSGNQRRGDDDVRIPCLLRIHVALRFLKTFAHYLGVAAPAAALLFIIDFDKFAAERFHLVGDFRARVVGTHNSTHARRRSDCRQTGHPCTRNKHLCGRHFAGGGNLSTEKPAECIRGFDHRAITRDAGHRGQRVHLLRARQSTRQTIDGEHRDFFRRKFLHQIRLLRWPNKAHQSLPLVHQFHFIQ